MFTIYGVYKNSDETEGRGTMVLVKLISDLDEAVKYIEAQPDAWSRQREWREYRYGDFEYRVHTVFDSFDEIKTNDFDAVKARALAKLTAEERRALGL